MSSPSKKNSRTRKCITLEPLEARTLYSADPFSAGMPVLGDTLEDHSITTSELFSTSALTDDFTTAESIDDIRLEIIFIDTTTPDYELLVADLQANSTSERVFEIVTINSDQDGIQKISVTLAKHSNVSAVHIISHGSNGNVNIGNTVLNQSTLSDYEEAIANWGNAFTDTGDLLIYGCDFSATDNGKSLGDRIAALTQVDIASSDNKTGGTSVGGDWVLEHMVGNIETALPFSDELQDNYQRSLASSITVTIGNDILDGDSSSFDALVIDPGLDGEISLREAIIAANSQGGADTINLAAGS